MYRTSVKSLHGQQYGNHAGQYRTLAASAVTPEQQPMAIGGGHPSDNGGVFGQRTVTDNRAIHTPKDFAEECFASFAVAP